MRPDSLWEVEFKIEEPMTSMPVPWEVVEEEQFSPIYRWEGAKRKRKKGIQFQYTLSGEGFFEKDGERFSIKPGVGFLSKHYEPGTSYYYPESGKEPWRFLWFSFYGVTAELMADDLIRRYGYLYKLPTDLAIIKRLLNYKNSNHRDIVISSVEGSRLVLDLLMTLGTTSETFLFESPQVVLVHNAQELVAKNSTLGVHQIAKQLNVSREFLSRTFKKEQGVTLRDYITDARIVTAQQLLKETAFTVENVALRSGFNYFSTFSRVFKKRVGMSPTAFRASGTVGH